MGFTYQLAILFVRAKAGIHAVVVGGGIAVIGGETVLRVGRVVLQHGGEPEGRHAQVGEIVEMLADALHVATMSQRGLRAVVDVGAEPCYLVVVLSAGGKAVGHEQIEHVADIKAHMLIAFHLSLFEHIVHLLHLFSCVEVQRHGAWPGIAQVEIDKQVVGRVESHQTVDGDAGIVGGDVVHPTDPLSVDHQLQTGVLHAHIPVGGIDATHGRLHVLRSTHSHYARQQSKDKANAFHKFLDE